MLAAGSEEVVGAAVRGDETAIASLYRELHPQLLRYLRHHVGRFAEDVGSEVWLGLAPQLAEFGGTIADLRALMFTIARRRVVDHYRQYGRRPSTCSLDDSADRADETDVEAVAVENVTAQGAVSALVRGLPDDQAEIVLLRALGELDVAQVAQIVGKSAGAVRIAQHRALQHLQQTLPRKAVTR